MSQFNSLYKKVLDTQTPLDDSFYEKVFDYFSVDLENRKPSPAVNESGEHVGTDLDLSSFLFALARRNAIVTIPNYTGLKPKTVREGETVHHHTERVAHLKGLYGNKESFSFGINTYDISVQNPDGTLGAPRKFTLVDPQGEWYSGWSSIGWKPDAKENEFLNSNKLWTGSSVLFSSFVHPNLRNSIYGLPYRTVKLAIQRLTEEGKTLFKLSKELNAKGITLPESEKKEWPKSTTGSKKAGTAKSINIMCFEAIIDHPDFGNLLGNVDEYSVFGVDLINVQGIAEFEASQLGLVKMVAERRKRVYDLIPALNFIARTMEFAFVKYNSNYTKPELTPEKIKNQDLHGIEGQANGSLVLWENNVKIGRKEFDVLQLDDDTTLRVRKYTKKERVAN